MKEKVDLTKTKVGLQEFYIGPRQNEEDFANFPVFLLNISFLKLLIVKNYR